MFDRIAGFIAGLFAVVACLLPFAWLAFVVWVLWLLAKALLKYIGG